MKHWQITAHVELVFIWYGCPCNNWPPNFWSRRKLHNPSRPLANFPEFQHERSLTSNQQPMERMGNRMKSLARLLIWPKPSHPSLENFRGFDETHPIKPQIHRAKTQTQLIEGLNWGSQDGLPAKSQRFESRFENAQCIRCFGAFSSATVRERTQAIGMAQMIFRRNAWNYLYDCILYVWIRPCKCHQIQGCFVSDMIALRQG